MNVMGGILSQAEIDAMLQSNPDNNLNSTTKVLLSSEEIDTLGEIGNISMGAAATTLNEILGKRVDITTPVVTITTMEDLSKEYAVPFIAVEVKYITGLEGSNILILKNEDVMTITEILMGEESTDSNTEMDEMRISILGEIMNQMAGASSTSLSTIIEKLVNIDPPKIFETKFDRNDIELLKNTNDIIKISFKLEIEGLINSVIMQLMPIDFARNLVHNLMNPIEILKEETKKEEKKEVRKETQDYNRQENVGGMKNEEKDSLQRKINVKSLTLESFDEVNLDDKQSRSENIDIIKDITLPITIELGKSKKKIKEILELNEGSIVILDKFAGDLVDVVVNGKLIAKGEVVIVDENYGVRITDLYSASDDSFRMRKD